MDTPAAPCVAGVDLQGDDMKNAFNILAFAMLAGSALSACTTPPATTTGPIGPSEPVVLPPEQADLYKAKSYAGLVGKPATDPAVPPAGRLVRHIRPDSIVTMDFVYARLNIEIDTKGIITGARCG